MLRADGYKIVNTLVTDLVPDRNVLRAMNDIETKKRERDAAQQAAEAKKVMVVMAAEAEKEARKLNGELNSNGVFEQSKRCRTNPHPNPNPNPNPRALP